jgi:TonB-dependent SusC/RagA subfamily outer membrane receptor
MLVRGLLIHGRAALAALAVSLAPGCRHASPAAPPPAPADSEQTNIGYGSQPRANVTGAIASVDSTEIARAHAERIDEVLEGKVAGVQILRRTGGISIRIRGTGTILGSGEPLYVVDGMIIEVAPGGALLGIDPSDIARIEVLKDAGSTAIYGSRGANGVVIITTKRASDPDR